MIKFEVGTKLCIRCGRPFESAFSLICDDCDTGRIVEREKICAQKARKAGLLLTKSRFVALYGLTNRDTGTIYARELPLSTIEDLLTRPYEVEVC